MAGAVALLGQQEAWAPALGFSPPTSAALPQAVATLIAAAALLWRRIAPLLVVAVVSAVLSAYSALFGAADGLGVFLPPLLAIYAAGRYTTETRFWMALALTAAATAIHEWRDPRFTWDGRTMTFWVILLAAGILGRLFQTRAVQLRGAGERARRLELERDERAQAAAAQERARIAGELHDLVGHGLTMMVMQLVAAQGTLERGMVEPTRARLERVEKIARNTLAEMRRLVDVLGEGDSSLSPPPGIAEIDELVQNARTDGLAVELTNTGMPAEVGTGIGLAAYRLVQEALTNVVKHAGPAVAHVVLACEGDTLTVEVVDDGSAAAAASGDGHGLAGMRQRVALYGGMLDAGPRPGGGFGVRATFPLGGAAL